MRACVCLCVCVCVCVCGGGGGGGTGRGARRLQNTRGKLHGSTAGALFRWCAFLPAFFLFIVTVVYAQEKINSQWSFGPGYALSVTSFVFLTLTAIAVGVLTRRNIPVAGAYAGF
jgi:hypothetical protein